MMHKQDSNPVILGSGELFLGLAKDIADLENLTSVEEGNLINIGAIESGATIDIGSEYQEVKSANRGVVARFKVDSSCRFSTGICTWVLQNVSKFLTGSTYTDNTTTKERKMIVGKDDNSPVVYLRFVHEKKDGTGKLIVNMYKSMFDGDLSFIFTNDNPVSINYEFTGMSNDDNNYVEIIETYDQESIEKGSIIVYHKCGEDILDFRVINKPYGTYTVNSIDIEDYELDDDISKEVTIDETNKIVTVEFEYKEAE